MLLYSVWYFGRTWLCRGAHGGVLVVRAHYHMMCVERLPQSLPHHGHGGGDTSFGQRENGQWRYYTTTTLLRYYDTTILHVQEEAVAHVAAPTLQAQSDLICTFRKTSERH